MYEQGQTCVEIVSVMQTSHTGVLGQPGSSNRTAVKLPAYVHGRGVKMAQLFNLYYLLA